MRTSLYPNIQLQYRLNRFLDIGANVGMLRFMETSSRAMGNAPFRDVQLANRGVDFNLMAGLGARLNYRVGQGDIQLAYYVGMVRQRRKDVSYLIRYDTEVTIYQQPLVDLFTKICFGYTYWPSEVIGVELRFQWIDLEHGRWDDRGVDEDGNNYYLIDRVVGEVPPVIDTGESTERNIVRPEQHEGISVGIVYLF